MLALTVSLSLSALFSADRSAQNVNEEIRETNLKYRREMNERKKLHNLVQELKGNIRVYMR